MLPQEPLLAAVRAAIHADRRILAALTYGSFSQGEADQYSDIEFYLYLDSPQDFDLHAWLAALAPVRLWLRNEFGTQVAVLEGLVRAEFHVEALPRVTEVAAWPERRVNVDAMLIKDQAGVLRAQLEALQRSGLSAPAPGQEAQNLWDRCLNWLVFGSGVLRRGERARAHELLGWVLGNLARLARLDEGALQHWLIRIPLHSVPCAKSAPCPPYRRICIPFLLACMFEEGRDAADR